MLGSPTVLGNCVNQNNWALLFLVFLFCLLIEPAARPVRYRGANHERDLGRNSPRPHQLWVRWKRRTSYGSPRKHAVEQTLKSTQRTALSWQSRPWKERYMRSWGTRISAEISQSQLTSGPLETSWAPVSPPVNWNMLSLRGSHGCQTLRWYVRG